MILHSAGVGFLFCFNLHMTDTPTSITDEEIGRRFENLAGRKPVSQQKNNVSKDSLNISNIIDKSLVISDHFKLLSFYANRLMLLCPKRQNKKKYQIY